jgi:hypothetical protein
VETQPRKHNKVYSFAVMVVMTVAFLSMAYSYVFYEKTRNFVRWVVKRTKWQHT